MKKPTLLYIPLFVLFAFAISVLAIHWSNMFRGYAVAVSLNDMPVIVNGEVSAARPEAEKAGLKVRDKLVAVNGRVVKTNDDYFKALAKTNPDEPINLTVARTGSDGQIENLEVSFKLPKVERDISFYSRHVAGFLFSYVLPTLCVLLGFYVVLVRPRDFLAWFLLFVLLGFSTIGIEGYSRNSLGGFYKSVFFNCWSLSMFLFALYFPERWS